MSVLRARETFMDRIERKPQIARYGKCAVMMLQEDSTTFEFHLQTVTVCFVFGRSQAQEAAGMDRQIVDNGVSAIGPNQEYHGY